MRFNQMGHWTGMSRWKGGDTLRKRNVRNDDVAPCLTSGDESCSQLAPNAKTMQAKRTSNNEFMINKQEG